MNLELQILEKLKNLVNKLYKKLKCKIARMMCDDEIHIKQIFYLNIIKTESDGFERPIVISVRDNKICITQADKSGIFEIDLCNFDEDEFENGLKMFLPKCNEIYK